MLPEKAAISSMRGRGKDLTSRNPISTSSAERNQLLIRSRRFRRFLVDMTFGNILESGLVALHHIYY